jgi:hypothetical protein
MPVNETSNQDGAKTKCEGHKQTLERLSMILPFSVLKNMANKPEDFESIDFDDLFGNRAIGGLDAWE